MKSIGDVNLVSPRAGFDYIAFPPLCQSLAKHVDPRKAGFVPHNYGLNDASVFIDVASSRCSSIPPDRSSRLQSERRAGGDGLIEGKRIVTQPIFWFSQRHPSGFAKGQRAPSRDVQIARVGDYSAGFEGKPSLF